MSERRCHSCTRRLIRVLVYAGELSGFEYCSRVCQARGERDYAEKHLKGDAAMSDENKKKKKTKGAEEEPASKKKTKGEKAEKAEKAEKPAKKTPTGDHPFKQKESLIRKVFDKACEDFISFERVKTIAEKAGANHQRLIRVLYNDKGCHGFTWDIETKKKDGVPYKFKINWKAPKGAGKKKKDADDE